MQIPKLTNLAPRNPLSIIALFISLIYGISALLLGATVSHLTNDNQDRIVIFIITFPVAILAGFLLLVIGHHRKLYAPADYRSDEGFLSNGQPSEIGEKFKIEADAAEAADAVETEEGSLPSATVGTDESTSHSDVDEFADANVLNTNDGLGSNDPIAATNVPSPAAPVPRPQHTAADLYMLEGLVFQELQSQLAAPIAREIVITAGASRYRFDGFIDGNPPTVIEVINGNVRKDNAVLSVSRLADAVQQMKLYHGTVPKFIIAVLVTSHLAGNKAKDRILSALADAGIAASIRVFLSNELIEKYGLADTSPRYSPYENSQSYRVHFEKQPPQSLMSQVSMLPGVSHVSTGMDGANAYAITIMGKPAQRDLVIKRMKSLFAAHDIEPVFIAQ